MCVYITGSIKVSKTSLESFSTFFLYSNSVTQLVNAETFRYLQSIIDDKKYDEIQNKMKPFLI